MILFVGHDASITGAPKSLLLIIAHISKNYNEPISIILKEGGPLEEEYRKLGKVFIWEKKWFYEKNIFIRLKNKINTYCRNNSYSTWFSFRCSSDGLLVFLFQKQNQGFF